MPRDPTEGLYKACSYCGKPAEEVRKLVAGPNVAICDECVGIAADVIRGTQPPVDPTWELVVAGYLPTRAGADHIAAATWRLQVPGGWVVITIARPATLDPMSSQVFVPDPTGAWHLPEPESGKP